MQNNTLIRWVGFTLVLSLLLYSCAPKKRTVAAVAGETWLSGTARRAVVNQLAEQQPYYRTFTGRAKSNFTLNGEKRYDVTTNIRIVHGEAIWISVTAIMGVEAARVLITPDSVQIINRLNSEYLSRPFSFLQDFAGNSLDFTSLERLLVGDVVAPLAGRDVDVWQGNGGYRLEVQERDLQYTMSLDDHYWNTYTTIADSLRGQQLEVQYADRRVVDGNSFPHQMKMVITTPQLALNADLAYQRAIYDTEVELPFSIPSRYTELQ